MRTFSLILIIAFCISSPVESRSVSFFGKTNVKFLTTRNAGNLIATKDEFISALSPFDRSARMKTDKQITENEFLEFLSSNVLDWSGQETLMLSNIFESILEKISVYNLHMPDTIYMIKTTGREEGDNPYTRMNAIILPRQILENRNIDFNKLLIHKLFHIIARNNPVKKEKLSRLIGFEKCNKVTFPSEILEVKITNPDSPSADHFVTLNSDGKTIMALPVTFSSRGKYNIKIGDSINDYLDFKLMIVENVNGNIQPKSAGGEPEYLTIEQMMDYYSVIGKNTYYVIHPEEILAENFSFMIQVEKDLPSPEIIEKMKGVLLHRHNIYRSIN